MPPPEMFVAKREADVIGRKADVGSLETPAVALMQFGSVPGTLYFQPSDRQKSRILAAGNLRNLET